MREKEEMIMKENSKSRISFGTLISLSRFLSIKRSYHSLSLGTLEIILPYERN